MTDRENGQSQLAASFWEAAQDPERAGELVGLGFDFLLEQPVSRLVTADRVLENLDAALRPAHVEQVLAHLRGFYDRDRERSKTRGDQVQDYLTEDATRVLRRLLGQPMVLDRTFLKELVKQDAMRHLLRSIVEETVERFVKALKPGGKNGLFSQLQRGPGMTILSRVASQMEAHIQKAASGFVQQSIEVLLGRLVHILSTPETAEQLGRLRVQGFEWVLPLHTRTLWKLTHQLPLDDLFALVAPLVAHNLAREDLRETILAEAEAVLAEEADRPLRSLVDPDAVATWRAQLVALGGPLLQEFLASEPLRRFLAATD